MQVSRVATVQSTFSVHFDFMIDDEKCSNREGALFVFLFLVNSFIDMFKNG